MTIEPTLQSKLERHGKPRDIHASAIVIEEAGILIRGTSGSGKSQLALALVAAAGRAGHFAILVGDDRISLEAHSGRLIARGHPLIRGRIERRGQGVLQTPFIAAAVIRLVIDLVPQEKAPPRYPEPDGDSLRLAGIKLPLLTLAQNNSACDLALSTLQRLRSERHS